METFTFTWREHDEDDFYQTSIPAMNKEEAHTKWLEWADGFWETDTSVLLYFNSQKEEQANG
jgi:hypothetical protein